jgi:hypothetical protein
MEFDILFYFCLGFIMFSQLWIMWYLSDIKYTLKKIYEYLEKIEGLKK